MKVDLFGGDTTEQSPWFQPDSKLFLSQRISLANLQDFIYGDSDKEMDDDESHVANPSGCIDGPHFRESLSSSYKAHKATTATSSAGNKSPMSVFHMITACTSSNIDQVKDMVGQAYQDALNTRCGQDFDEYEDMAIPPSMDTFEDEEDIRLRRLGSWNTLGTMGTLGTAATQELAVLQQFDDDGHPINPKILQATHENKRQNQHSPKRTRLVKFDYPPVSSMRQCPRAERDDLPELFFTEEELENYEADRECTRRTDDIEIVAISKSLSDLNQQAASEVEEIEDPSARSPATSPRGGFGSYVPTPRILNNRRTVKPHEPFSFSEGLPVGRKD